jgi:fructose-1,6-bisphosphatase/sedoheptulose 1,7-bisphosphatase-like protein
MKEVKAKNQMLIYTRILMVLQIISSLMSLGVAIFLLAKGDVVVGVAVAVIQTFLIWVAYSNYSEASACVVAHDRGDRGAPAKK